MTFGLRPRGVMLLLLAAGSLLWGIVGAELGMMVWGLFMSSLCLLGAGGALAGWLLLRRAAKNGRAEVQLQWPRPHAGDRVQLNLSSNLPGFLWNRLWLEIRLFSQDDRRLSLDVPLLAGQSRREAGFVAPGRGLYQGKDGRGGTALVIGDPAGLFFCRWPLGVDERLEVLTKAVEAGEERMRLRGGEQERRDHSILRSDELFDTRKYRSGDDPRRLHWKMFAHSGELFLRIGEDLPPPDAELFLTLCPDWPGLKQDQHAAMTDELCRALLRLAKGAAAQASSLYWHDAANDRVCSAAPDDLETLQSWCAAIAAASPTNPDALLRALEQSGRRVLVLCAFPGQVADALAVRAAQSGCQVLVCHPVLPAVGGPGAAGADREAGLASRVLFWLDRILRFPAGTRPEIIAPRGYDAALASALHRGGEAGNVRYRAIF